MRISNEDERIKNIRAKLKIGKDARNENSKNAGFLPPTDGSVIEGVTYADLTSPANSPAQEKPKVIGGEVGPLLITDTRIAKQEALKKEEVERQDEITERLKRNLASGAESLPELDGNEEGKKNQGKIPKLDESYLTKLEIKQENQRLKQEESDRVKKIQEATTLQLEGENDEFIDLLSEHNNLKLNGDFGYIDDQWNMLEQNKKEIEKEGERRGALVESFKRKGEVLRTQREKTEKQKIEQTKEKIEKVDSLEKLFEIGCEFQNVTEQSKRDEFRKHVCEYLFQGKTNIKDKKLKEINLYDKLNNFKKELDKKLGIIPDFTTWEELNKYIVLEIQPKIFFYPEHKEINIANCLSEEVLEKFWTKYIPEKYIDSIRKLKKQDVQYNSLKLRRNRIQQNLEKNVEEMADTYKPIYQETEASEESFRKTLAEEILRYLPEIQAYYTEINSFKEEYGDVQKISGLMLGNKECSDFSIFQDHFIDILLKNIKDQYLKEEIKKWESINNSPDITPKIEKKSLGNFGITKEKKMVEVDYQPTISFNEYLTKSIFFTQLRESKIKGDIEKFTKIILGPVSSDILEKGKMVVELFGRYYSVKNRSDMRILARNLFNFKPTK